VAWARGWDLSGAESCCATMFCWAPRWLSWRWPGAAAPQVMAATLHTGPSSLVERGCKTPMKMRALKSPWGRHGQPLHVVNR
jgi:hypothetical protein